MNWLRRLFAPNTRGTLTLLDHGVIVGAPPDWGLTPDEAMHLRAVLEAWLSEDRTRPLVLPWPVDVTDHRTKP